MNYPILSLRVVRFNDETLAEPIAIAFGPTGGTIGRANDCTLVLPDQQRAISRVHARVEFRGGDYLLCDLGSNPSVLNQRALGGTREARLADGDRLLIGSYLLEVSIGEQPAGLRSLTGGHDPLSAAQVLGGPLPADQQGDMLRLGSLDPLGQPGFGEQQRISSRPGFAGSESDHVSPELQAFSLPQPARQEPARTAPPAAGIPADYDPLADALAQWETPAQAGSASYAATPRHAPQEAPPWPAAAAAPAPQGGPTGLPPGLLDTSVPGAAATPFDDLFGTPSASSASSTPFAPGVPVVPVVVPVVAPQAASVRLVTPAPSNAPSPPVPPVAPSPVEPFAPSAAAPFASPSEPPFAPVAPPTSAPPPTAEGAPAQAFAAEVAGSGQPAMPSATRTTRATPARQDAPVSASANAATFQALLEGLGLDPSRAPNLPEPEFARLIGEMLRESLRGTMAVLRARSMTKREARLDTTMIVARDNNPLKFFPDVDSALAQMLTGRNAGYLPPDEALKRAFNDIEAHELAVLAGMRAALAHVLGRFDPASLEAQLKEPGALEKVLSNRKAKLWDLFVESQGAVAREADDDVQKLYGRAFNDAYEAQIEALHAARERQPKDPANPT
ncbi:type VI secretion system-associated FHA domain protein TagH [Paraburkholderia fungorum]|uniref:type VI secretion system-associated FHA domain protein TagH n=1 Tax=Paraburkholderia fungorum TaxID=134537 RepID=UPI0038B94914